MLWLISSAILLASSEPASSWKGSPLGQANCGSRLPCLHIPSARSSSEQQETTAPRDINTWYPIPKWRIDSHFRQRNTNGYSEPYPNKRNIQRTDGNIFHDNHISEAVPGLEKNRMEVFERLNIQFLPLKDGNITVKGLQERINDSVREEYVALFVVYKHSNKEHAAPKSEVNFTGGKKNEGFMREKGNVTLVDCDEPYGCTLDVHKQSFNSSLLKNRVVQNGEEMLTILVSTNMSIEMKIGLSDDNNYTVIIMPLTKLKNTTEDEGKEIPSNDIRTINITLTSNMSMVMKSSDLLHLNESTHNEFTSPFTTEENELRESLTEENEFLNSTSSTFEVHNTSTKPVDQGSVNDLENIHVTAGEDSVVFATASEITLIDDGIINTPTTFENIQYTGGINDGSHFELPDKRQNVSERFRNGLMHDANKTLNSPTESIGLQNISLKENTQPLDDNYSFENSSKKGSPRYTYGFDYYEKLGTYEVRKLDGRHSPFIVTIHLTVTNNGIKNETDYVFHISSRNVNNSNSTNDHFVHYTEASPESRLSRRKRKISNGYSLVGHEIYHRTNKREEKIIRDEFPSHENKINNKYSRRKRRVILNKTEETVKTMNQFSLISAKESTLTPGQNNISRLFLLLQRPVSYSFSTIANSDEEFNKNTAYGFRSKGLLASEMRSRGTESNQTAHGNRIRREVSSPALIPDKDSGENRSPLKKSELQIVEGAPPLDKYPDGWKLETPPEEHRSLRNVIKRSKICYFGDDCRRTSGSFNSMDDSKYRKVHQKNRSFDLYENAKENARIDPGNKPFNYTVIASKINKSPYMEANSKSHLNNRTRSELLDTPLKYHVLHYLNSMKKLFYSEGASESFDEAYSKIKTADSTDYLLNKNESKRGDISNVNDIKNFNLNENLDKHGYKNEHLSNSASKVPHSITEESASESRKLIFMNSNKYLLKTFFPIGPLSRRKRSSFYPSSTYSPSPFYMSNLNVNPNQMNFHRVYAPLKHNISLLNQGKQANNVRKQTLRQQFTPTASNARPGNINAVLLRSSRKEIGRGSIMPMITSPTKVDRGKKETQKITSNRSGRDYTWILIAPEFVFDYDGPVNENPKKAPVFDKEGVATTVKPNADRETEDFDWENNEWMLITPESEHNRKNTNAFVPPREQKPDGIVNIPAERPGNCMTTKYPVVKTIPKRTARPQIRPIPYTTFKPAAFPNFRPATSTWLESKPWDSNGWSVSQNPWTGYPVRPVRMMPGMAGGD